MLLKIIIHYYLKNNKFVEKNSWLVKNNKLFLKRIIKDGIKFIYIYILRGPLVEK